MLFEMLAGKTPYRGPFGVVMLQIQTAPVPPVKEFRSDVDSRLDAICRKAMAKTPAERFASMAEFADALGQYLKDPSVLPPGGVGITRSAAGQRYLPFVDNGSGRRLPAAARFAEKSETMASRGRRRGIGRSGAAGRLAGDHRAPRRNAERDPCRRDGRQGR